MLDKTLNSIKHIENKSKYFVLIGDKGYKTKDKFKLNNKNVKIITPNKNNAVKNLNKKSENKKLKHRIKVEHAFKNIKFFERIRTRKDRLLSIFMSWIYISCLLNNINC